MNQKVTLRNVGSSIGLFFSKEIVARQNWKVGDELFVTETKEGITLTPYDPEFQRALQIAAKGMEKYKNALHELAK